MVDRVAEAMYGRGAHIAAVLLWAAQLACGGDDAAGGSTSATDATTAADSDSGSADSGSSGGPGPMEIQLLDCPEPGALPFTTEAMEFTNSTASQNAQNNPRFKNEASDTLGLPEGVLAHTTIEVTDTPAAGLLTLVGIKGRAQNDTGLASNPLPGEPVSLWTYDIAGGAWVSLARQNTANDGGYTFTEIEASQHPLQPIYSVLEADGSCAPHYNFLLPATTPVVVSDIDGTLTASDSELVMQLSDLSYDQAEKGAAAQMLSTWWDKGYVVVYLTARPHVLRPETRTWLAAHGYPVGPIISANALVSGDSARQYKAAWVSRVVDDFGWSVAAVYGNAGSDIDAYDDAGIPKEITFIIGENAGSLNTVPIENDDYTAHIADFVDAQPDGPGLPLP